jgi:uncharacterized membrane protein YadS
VAIPEGGLSATLKEGGHAISHFLGEVLVNLSSVAGGAAVVLVLVRVLLLLPLRLLLEVVHEEREKICLEGAF